MVWIMYILNENEYVLELIVNEHVNIEIYVTYVYAKVYVYVYCICYMFTCVFYLCSNVCTYVL